MRLTDLAIKALPFPPKGAKVHHCDTLTGFGVRVTAAGVKSFVLTYGVNRERVTIGRYPIIGLADARAEAKRILAERTLGRHQEPKTTLGAALDLFAEHHTAKLAPSTQREMGRLFTRHLTKLRTKKLADITTRDITAVTDKTAPSEGEHFHRACKTFFRWCVRRRMLQHSPIEGLELPSKWKPRERVLSDDELRAVWKAADELGGNFGGIIKLLILTGQRRSEIANLRGDWITCPKSTSGNTGGVVRTALHSGSDGDSGAASSVMYGAILGTLAGAEATIVVSAEGADTKSTTSICIPSTHTKNKRSHTFPIGALSSGILLSLSQQCGCLFSARGSSGTKHFNGWSKAKAQLDTKVADIYKKNCILIDLEPKPIRSYTLHDLRRTYATNLQRLGIKLEVIEALLNHVSGTRSGIVGVYQRHRYEAEMREAVTTFEDWFTRNIVGGGHEPIRRTGSPAAHA